MYTYRDRLLLGAYASSRINISSFDLNSQFCIYINTVFYFFFLIFIFGCVGSSLVCAGFLQLWRAGATLRCGAQASHCSGFACCGAWAQGTQAQQFGMGALERRLSSCSTWAQLFCGMWDLPGPGLEPMSPALAGGFLSTAPPGKPLVFYY